jgi:hypothetical protein
VDVLQLSRTQKEGKNLVEKTHIILENISLIIKKNVRNRALKVLLMRAQKEMKNMLLQTVETIIFEIQC